MKALFPTIAVVSAIAVAASAFAFMGPSYRPLGVEFLQNNPYTPSTISAQVSGSSTPPRIPNPSAEDFIVINGDFRILLGAGTNVALGDGINEVTVWDFDFSRDPQFEHFPTTTPLGSALLTITLTPKSLMFTSDILRFGTLPMINPAIYTELPQDSQSNVQLELLDFYSSEGILEALTSGQGRVTGVSASNAIVSSAELVLIPQSSMNMVGPSRVNLSGQVLTQDGEPPGLSGTTVALFGDGDPQNMRSVATGPDGSFSVEVEPGTYRLFTTWDGWQSQSTQIVIPENGLSLGPMHLLPVAEHSICPAPTPGDDNAPGIASVTLRGNQDNALLFSADVELEQPAHVWAEFHAVGDEANVLRTPPTESMAINQQLLFSRLRPDTTYCFQVFATFEEIGGPDESAMVSESFHGSFDTGPLPPGLAGSSFTLLSGQQTHSLTLLDINKGDFRGIVAIDAAGQVVWYHQHEADAFAVAQDDNYNLVFSERLGDSLIEITPDGTLVRQVTDTLEDGTTCSPFGRWHHEILLQPGERVYTLGSETREVLIDGEVMRLTGDTIVAWDRNEGTVETLASLFDLLDPGVDRTTASAATGGFFWRGCEGEVESAQDWTHANSLWSGAEGNILMSLRHLNQVISIAPDLETVQWRLGGPRSDFTFPDPSDRFYHQHTAKELPNGNILLFDNGATRPAAEGGEYSRALELELDFESMEARKVWEYRRNPDLFANCCSSVERLSNGNTVLVFGSDHTVDVCCRTITLVEADDEGQPVSVIEIAAPNLSIVYRVYPIESIAGELPAP